MRTHTPANTKTDTGFALSGKTLCGKSNNTSQLSTGKPSCGHCSRNLRTIPGFMRDGRAYMGDN